MATYNLGEIDEALRNINDTGVDITGKGLKLENADAAREVIEQINNCKNLKYLNLEGNTLGVDAAKAIGESLKSHAEFEEALWKDLFTGRLKTEIPLALKSLGEGIIAAGAKLKVLDCSDNALGPNGMVGLVELIESPACYSLETLRLNNCGLGIDGGKMLSKALLNCYKASVKAGSPLALKVFIAGRNRLENHGATALAEVFENLKSLEEVAMPQNGIYHVGISALSRGFQMNIKMQILNLNDNTIGPKGSVALAPAFEKMESLREINFGDCLLKTEGAVAIGDALSDGHLALETLDLEFNEIGPRGGRAIYVAMENKPNLKNLALNGNHFGKAFREEMISDLKIVDKSTVLGSLSQDESGDDDDDYGEDEEGDDEEDEYDDEYDEGDEEEDVDDENYVENDLHVVNTSTQSLNNSLDTSTKSIVYVDTENLPSTIESFVRLPHPTSDFFNKIVEEPKIDGFRRYLTTLPSESYITYTVFTILKLSAISDKSKEALNISADLYSDVFKFAKTTYQISRVRNFFLIQLGLLKAEEKTFRPVYNLNACRFALENAIKVKSIPEDMADQFACFLERMK